MQLENYIKHLYGSGIWDTTDCMIMSDKHDGIVFNYLNEEDLIKVYQYDTDRSIATNVGSAILFGNSEFNPRYSYDLYNIIVFLSLVNYESMRIPINVNSDGASLRNSYFNSVDKLIDFIKCFYVGHLSDGIIESFLNFTSEFGIQDGPSVDRFLARLKQFYTFIYDFRWFARGENKKLLKPDNIPIFKIYFMATFCIKIFREYLRNQSNSGLFNWNNIISGEGWVAAEIEAFGSLTIADVSPYMLFQGAGAILNRVAIKPEIRNVSNDNLSAFANWIIDNKTHKEIMKHLLEYTTFNKPRPLTITKYHTSMLNILYLNIARFNYSSGLKLARRTADLALFHQREMIEIVNPIKVSIVIINGIKYVVKKESQQWSQTVERMQEELEYFKVIIAKEIGK
eukprot:NODE_337_length_10662_cov_0.497207.p3 type:complete len:398 gc:universal NODE_337_length_10662_cov_0.497207:6663-5470(-)